MGKGFDPEHFDLKETGSGPEAAFSADTPTDCSKQYKHSERAKTTQPLFPHALRHFLFTRLKKQRFDDEMKKFPV